MKNNTKIITFKNGKQLSVPQEVVNTINRKIINNTIGQANNTFESFNFNENPDVSVMININEIAFIS